MWLTRVRVVVVGVMHKPHGLTSLIPENDPVDMAFDRAGTPGQRKTRGDSLVITPEAVGEGVQGGQVVGVDGVRPCWRTVSAEVADYAHEGMHVAAAGKQLWAPAETASSWRSSSSRKRWGFHMIQLVTC